ncbi:MAG: nucleoside recognition domain-containing protein [Candidatus Hinthialibacter sp.]
MNNQQITAEDILADAASLRWELGETIHESLMESIFQEAASIAGEVVSFSEKKKKNWDQTLDWLFTSKLTGFPIMFGLLAGVLWLTISGANVPSSMLAALLLDTVHPWLKAVAGQIGMPWWMDGLLIDGMYLSTAWVVSVMLPPMAIFFPLFTLFEDFGYLPRVAFNMDHLFKKVGAHGRQALTMSMGYGCNAAGVVSCRIIDSPRERLIAIITNNFSVCNGRWPTLILISSIFVGAAVSSPFLGSIVSSATVMAVMLLGILFTFAVSWLLSNTMLRGEASIYSMELPPYRPPRILQTLYTSLIDRTIYVLWRAIVFALPAGAVIWLLCNISVADQSLAVHLIRMLNPFGLLIGLNGVILLAYIIAIPANEIVIPTILMLTVLTTGMTGVGEGAGVMFELESEADTATLLQNGGWTLLTAVNLLLFCLLHNPCSTAIYTIWKETGSVKWTAVAALLPLGIGLFVCFFVTQIWRLITTAS